MLKQGCIHVSDIPHQRGPLAPTLRKLLALIHIDSSPFSALRDHVERPLMLKKKWIGKMMIFHQNRSCGRHHLTIP